MSIFPWYMWVLLAAVAVSASSLVEKKVLVKEHPTRFAVSLATMGALVSFPLLFFVEWQSLSAEYLLWVYGASLISITAIWVTAHVIRNLELGEVSAFLLTTPIFVAILSALLLGEILTLVQGAGITVAMLGMGILEWHMIREVLNSPKKHVNIQYLLLAAVATLLYSVSAIFDRYILTTFPARPTDLVIIIQCCTAVNAVIISRLYYGNHEHVIKGIQAHWRALGAMSLLLTVSRVFYAHAVAITFVVFVSVFKRGMSALFTNFFSHLIFKEERFYQKMTAAVCIIAGIILVI